ncbi:metalloproteinase inhibitor 2-like [Tubulanus polymorphus]|uniref:metalloproteinase inhibitor 2-like n=1 Tax=Tubulanus polymorphus TaxID=672921 RepID=UPI003DA31C79
MSTKAFLKSHIPPNDGNLVRSIKNFKKFDEMISKQLIIICALMVTSSNACKCRKVPLQRQYCQADFVLRGSPTSVAAVNSNERVYTIDVHTTFRIRVYYIIYRVNISKLYTKETKVSCGRRLKLGEQYVITGFMQKYRAGKYKPYITACTYAKMWKRMSPRERSYMGAHCVSDCVQFLYTSHLVKKKSTKNL